MKLRTPDLAAIQINLLNFKKQVDRGRQAGESGDYQKQIAIIYIKEEIRIIFDTNCRNPLKRFSEATDRKLKPCPAQFQGNEILES